MTDHGYLLDNRAPAAGRRLDALGELFDGSIEHVRERLIASGRASGAELEQHLANVDAGILDLATSPMISAWGRRGPPPASFAALARELTES